MNCFRKLLVPFLLTIYSLQVSSATYNVTNDNNAGAGSLRQAILDANANPGADIINVTANYYINVLSPLPTITDQLSITNNRLEIDGASCSPNNNGLYVNAANCTINRLYVYRFTVGIRIERANTTVSACNIGMTTADLALANQIGVFITSSDNQIISSFISGNSGSGIILDGAGAIRNKIQSCYIGVKSDGITALANGTQGVLLQSGASSNIIGTDSDGLNDATEGNLLSGNGASGVRIIAGSNQNIVAGNKIGTNINGTAALANLSAGIYISNSNNNQIGGGLAAQRNIISCNRWDGIDIISNSTGNKVQGNYIGVDINGTANLGNRYYGIYTQDVTYTLIGTNADGINDATEGNVIAGNSFTAIHLFMNCHYNIVAGNLMGTNAAGTAIIANGLFNLYVNASNYNQIGGPLAVQRNLISGSNSYGIYIENCTQINKIQGNYIGTNKAGTAALPNRSYGIWAFNSLTNLIVGTDGDGVNDATEGNLISGNNNYGIYIEANTYSNVFAGNLIGTNATGTGILPNGGGIYITGGNNNNKIGGSLAAQRNIISGNGGHGIGIESGTSGTKIQNNYIGTDITGTLDLGNRAHGVYLILNVTNTVIGTDGDGVNDANEGNLISGNKDCGIRIHNTSPGNVVAGNLIGTNAAGTAAVGNTNYGVLISGGSINNTIGTNGNGVSDALEGNLISGNYNGVFIDNSSRNIVTGNKIGTDKAGTVSVANTHDGVYLKSANDNRIGGTGTDDANTIAFNTLRGIAVESGTGNAFRRNSIFSNGGLGIDLNVDGVTLNDAGDADTGPNQLQNFPVIASHQWTSTTVRVTGTFNSEPNKVYILEFFVSVSRDPSGYGEGSRYIGTTNVSTDASGNATYDVVLAVTVPAGYYVTATATDPSNNTSEFSGSSITPLPVTLLQFNVKASDNNALLTWHSANERAFAGYVVEKSQDGGTFDSLGFVPAGLTSYAFRDQSVVTGLTYYRLKMMDRNGVYTYSSIKAVNSSSLGLVLVYPNPAKEVLNVVLNEMEAGELIIVITDINGLKVYEYREECVEKTGVRHNIATNGFLPGAYVVSVCTATGDMYRQKLIIQ